MMSRTKRKHGGVSVAGNKARVRSSKQPKTSHTNGATHFKRLILTVADEQQLTLTPPAPPLPPAPNVPTAVDLSSDPFLLEQLVDDEDVNAVDPIESAIAAYKKKQEADFDWSALEDDEYPSLAYLYHPYVTRTPTPSQATSSVPPARADSLDGAEVAYQRAIQDISQGGELIDEAAMTQAVADDEIQDTHISMAWTKHTASTQQTPPSSNITSSALSLAQHVTY